MIASAFRRRSHGLPGPDLSSITQSSRRALRDDPRLSNVPFTTGGENDSVLREEPNWASRRPAPSKTKHVMREIRSCVRILQRIERDGSAPVAA